MSGNRMDNNKELIIDRKDLSQQGGTKENTVGIVLGTACFRNNNTGFSQLFRVVLKALEFPSF